MTHVNLLALQKQADIRTPEMLLDLALPLIIAEIDAVIQAEIFRLTRGGMAVWHVENSTREIGAFIPLEEQSLQQKAILEQKAVTDEEAQLLFLPLINGKEVFALLTLGFKSVLDSEVMADIADDLGLMLYSLHMNSILRQQITVTGKLSIADSLTEVTTIIAGIMAQRRQFVTMNVFDYDNTGKIVGGRIIATANRNTAFSHNADMEIDIAALRDLHNILMADGDAVVSDIETEERLSEGARDWVKAQKINSMIIVPLWIDSHLHAFLCLADTAGSLALSELEKELFHNMAHQAAITIEKQRLLEQTKRSALRSDEQLQILRRINELIGQTNKQETDDPILQNMADMLLEVTRVDHVGVVMQDGEITRVVSEAPDKGQVGNSIETGENSLHNILQETKEAFVVLDVLNDTNLPLKTAEDLGKSNVLSVVVVPMFDATDNLIGSVGLDYYEKQDSIDPAIIEATRTIVTQIALSLQKIRLLAEAQQKADQLERLTEFGQMLRAYLTIPLILSTTVEHCPGVVQSDYVGVLLYDRSSNTLRQNASHFLGENNISVQAIGIDEESNSIALKAWSSHELVIVHDLHSDWKWKHTLHRELQSVIAIPLSQAGVTLGILEIGSVNPHQFNATDITTLRQMSNQLAIALSNALAYSQSQRLARNKIQANEIVSKLQEQLEIGDILSITVQELGKAIGAKRARIRLGKQEEANS